VAFKDLRKYLTTPPTLMAPEPHENLHPYISATSNVVVQQSSSNERSQTPITRSSTQSISSAKC
jgi:hypothetical protein